MFVDQATYLDIVRVLRAQPAHRRPNFLDASEKVGVDRRTIATGWERGWPASKDPRRPAPLPPLKEVCAPGTTPPPGLEEEPPHMVEMRVSPPRSAVPAERPSSAEVKGAPLGSSVASVPSGPSSEPNAKAPGHKPGPVAPSPVPPASMIAAPVARDPVAEIAARQSALEAQEARTLAGSLSIAEHIAATGDVVLKLLYDAVTSPAAQERLRSFIVERPERFPGLLAELAKAAEASSKASERVFTMSRLAQGKSTSIQEHRTGNTPPETPAQAAARVRAVFDELAVANQNLDGHGRPLALEPIDVTPLAPEETDATSS